MKTFMRRFVAFVLLPALLGACRSTPPAPVPAVIPGLSLGVALADGENADQPWTRGGGTLVLSAYDAASMGMVGDAVAAVILDSLGTGTLRLPGGADGVEARATLPVTSTVSAIHDPYSMCVSTLSESVPGALALLTRYGEFTSNKESVTMIEKTVTPVGADYVTRLRVPVFVTKDVTITGTITCSPTEVISVDLPLKKGWNVAVSIFDFPNNSFSLRLDSHPSLHFAPDY